MKRGIRIPLAGAIVAAAAALSACEHMGDEVGLFLTDSLIDGVQESLADRDCADRYYGDLSARARCDLDDGR